MFITNRKVFKTSSGPEDPSSAMIKRLTPKKKESMMQGTQMDKTPEKSKEELKVQVEGEHKKTETVSVMVGRVLFEGVIKETKVLNLLCEECANDLAVMKCIQCDQIFCARCCQLCHPLTQEDEGMHLHERMGTRLGRPTGLGFRPLQHGDTSRVKIEIPFEMPDRIVQEEEFEKLKLNPHTDLTKVNCLAVNRDDDKKPSRDPYQNPRFQVGEQLLFMDPDSHEEAYGRVISEWCFRHGQSAPPVLRGEGAIVYYMVHKLGLCSELGPDCYAKLVRAKPECEKLAPLPKLEGCEDAKYRQEKYLAGDIDRKLAEMRTLQKYGPKHHLKSEFPELDPEEVVIDRSKGVPEFKPEPNDLISENPPRKLYQHLQLHKNDNGVDPYEQKHISSIEVNPKSPRRATLRRYKHALKPGHVGSEDNPSVSSANSSVNSYYHTVADDDVSILSGINPIGIHAENDEVDMEQALGLLVLPDYALERPSKKLERLLKAKFARVRGALERRFMNGVEESYRWAFTIWHDQLDELKNKKFYICARKIQSVARMWFLRNELIVGSYHISHGYKGRRGILWQKELERRWNKLHSQFNYTTKDDPYAFTTNRKQFFRTLNDLNKYNALLIKDVNRCVQFLTKKRWKILKFGFKKWVIGAGISGLTEGDIKSTHFLDYATEPEPLYAIAPDKFQEKASKINEETNQFFKVTSGVDIVEETIASESYIKMKYLEESTSDVHYENVFNQPLAFGKAGTVMVTDENGESRELPHPGVMPRAVPKEIVEKETILDTKSTLPPPHPSVGMSFFGKPGLPKLPKLHEPSTMKERLVNKTSDKLKLYGFLNVTQGATDTSCWVIPGMLAIGSVPYGLAREGLPMDCVSAIVLSGVGTMVSLMGEDEEKYVEETWLKHPMYKDQSSMTPIKDLMQTAGRKARFSVASLLAENQDIIEKNKKQIKNIPNVDKTDKKYAKYKRERLRAQARINMATESSAKSQLQLERYPKTLDWIRIPLSASSVPTIHEFITILWDLEAKLRRGEVLYLYSKEGHGRVGYVAAALVGRLYGLKSRDALYRIQCCHDAIKIYSDLEVPIQCPQLEIQRRLVHDAIDHANRHFEGVTWRSLSQPDQGIAEVHGPVRGSHKGLLDDFTDGSGGAIIETRPWSKQAVKHRHSTDIDAIEQKYTLFDRTKSPNQRAAEIAENNAIIKKINDQRGSRMQGMGVGSSSSLGSKSSKGSKGSKKSTSALICEDNAENENKDVECEQAVERRKSIVKERREMRRRASIMENKRRSLALLKEDRADGEMDDDKIVTLEPHPTHDKGVLIHGGNSTLKYPVYVDGEKLSGDLPPTGSTDQRRGIPSDTLKQRGIGSGVVSRGDHLVPSAPVARPIPSGPPRFPLIRLARNSIIPGTVIDNKTIDPSKFSSLPSHMLLKHDHPMRESISRSSTPYNKRSDPQIYGPNPHPVM